MSLKATNWGGMSESPYKKVGPVSVLDGHVKEPYEMSMALVARPSNVFSQPAHLCAVTNMTEISFIVTFNNQFN